MAGNTRELIKALCLLADEQNIKVTVKKSPFVRGAEIANNFGSEEASNYLKFVRVMNGPPRPLSDVILNDLSQSQRIELIDQVIKAITKDIDVDSSKVWS